jgi:hypothetical protein
MRIDLILASPRLALPELGLPGGRSTAMYTLANRFHSAILLTLILAMLSLTGCANN